MFVLRGQLTTHKHNNLNIMQTNLTYFLQYYEEYSPCVQKLLQLPSTTSF
jgi:hypothetical protein